MTGVPAEDLPDEALERELAHLHETRHDTFLHGSDDALDLRTHRRRHPAATGGAGPARRLGTPLRARSDRPLLVRVVGQQRHRAEGQRQRRRGDRGGVPPERATGVVRGDEVGEQATGKNGHGEGLRSE